MIKSVINAAGTNWEKENLRNMLSLLVSFLGLLAGFYYWHKSERSLPFDEIFKAVRVIAFFWLLVFLSLLNAIFGLCANKNKLQISLWVNVVLAALALFILALDHGLLVY